MITRADLSSFRNRPLGAGQPIGVDLPCKVPDLVLCEALGGTPTHISALDNYSVDEAMSSSSQSPRSRHRFGFRGKRSSRETKRATTDETLESLIRHAESMEKDGEERTIGLQTILELEPEAESTQFSNLESTKTLEHFGTRHIGRSAFALMLLGGVAFLSIYSNLRQIFTPPSLTIVQQTITEVGFSDWQKALLIALSAFISALLANRSRNRIRTHSFSTD
jgi:hypothetical protein